MNPGSGITTILFNHSTISAHELKKIIVSLADPAVLAEKGGFLFKAHIRAHEIALGVIPSFFEGARNYHYDIHISSKTDIVLSGFINANTNITLLAEYPPPLKNDLQDITIKVKTLHLFAQFSLFLTEWGMPPDTPLDTITQGIVRDFAQGSPSIETVHQLAEIY